MKGGVFGSWRVGLAIGDVLLSNFVFFPLMVLYWRGIFDLWGVYIYPNTIHTRHWILVIIGSLAIIGYFTGPALDRILPRDTWTRTIVIRVYMYVWALFYMCFWRAIWETSDFYFGYGMFSNIISFVVSYGFLLVMRTSRTTVFPPYVVILDTRKGALQVSTRLAQRPFTVLFALDCIFTYFFTITMTIEAWRSMWNIQGILVSQLSPLMADIISLTVGYAFALLFMGAGDLLGIVSSRLEKKGFYYKLIYEDAVYSLVFLVMVTLWRGGWNLCATYVLADPEVGGWVCHIVGTIGLYAFNLFSFAGACGCAIDGDDEGGDAFFPIKYLRVYVQARLDAKQAAKAKDLQKKISSLQESTTMLDLKQTAISSKLTAIHEDVVYKQTAVGMENGDLSAKLANKQEVIDRLDEESETETEGLMSAESRNEENVTV